MKRAFAVLVLAVGAYAQPLAERIEKLIAASPAARTAFWGIQAVNLANHKTLYELNADHFFVPASNTKLFTTALALTSLGPDFKFQTRVFVDSPADASGVVHGDLRLMGGGDPNLSARAIPYRPGAVTGDPLVAIEDLADQVVAHGVKRIEGGIVGDDTFYTWEPYAEGWSIDDPQYDYGAAVSALCVNDNMLTLAIRPGANEGEPAALTLRPAIEYYQIDNRILTVEAGGERKVHSERAAGSMTVRLWGTIPLGDRGQDLSLGVQDPAQYAALALLQALEKRGVTVTGEARARHLLPGEEADLREDQTAELARRESAPLLEGLRITDKVSQNLHAEMTLRAVGRARRGAGSREAGLAELRDFLTEAGVASDAYNIADGSGLTRLNLVTPATVVKLLSHMYASPARENWISLLPVGGQDGTLNTRFGKSPGAGRIHAKTGSLSHVSALSGYVERANGGWIAFSILVNNFNGGNGEVRGVMDRICSLLLEY